jgi:glycosyltransferase involved in cell wall biosynthesis
MTGQKIAVIPTCADLGRFVPAQAPPATRVIGCLGTVLSGWFRLDWLASFLTVVAARDPEVRFELTTLDDPAAVRAALDPAGELGSRLTIAPSPQDKVQDVLQRQTASVMFFTDGLSKLGSSPTRMGEILGCGMPVLANDGVGDVAAIIRKHRVGVLAESAAPEAMAQAWDALLALLAEPDIAARCRAAAEEVFSLEAGTRAYAALYRALAGEAA